MGLRRAAAFAAVALAFTGCAQPPDPSSPTASATPSPETSPSTTAPSLTETTTWAPARPTHRGDPEIPSESEREALAPCEGQEFRTAPVETGLLTSITPIGNLAPPGHTFPTEHPFLHLWPGGSTDRKVPLSAPAAVTVSLVTVNRGATQDPVDYTIWFAPCRELVAYYNHVKELPADLQAIVDAGACQFPGESKDSRCNVQTFHAMSDGQSMGGVGGLQGNFDFGALDLRTTHTFANASRYSTRSLHIRCAFDYYPEPMRETFVARFEREDGQCGTSAQDVPGTLQGNWFHESTRDSVSEWTKHLAFAMDNRLPSQSVVSIGGQVHEAATLRFDAATAGAINRRFQDVQPGSGLQCYQGEGVPGKVLVELGTPATLRIEHQGGACTAYESFERPHTYLR